jgi:hypothetical protein
MQISGLSVVLYNTHICATGVLQLIWARLSKITTTKSLQNKTEGRKCLGRNKPGSGLITWIVDGFMGISTIAMGSVKK